MTRKGKMQCLCCGEEVETIIVDRHGSIEVTCIHCGFVIDQYLESGEKKNDGKKTDHSLVIMLAEDSEATRKLVEITLRETDFISEVSTFENGKVFVKAAAERIQGGRPLDIVILDIEMPVMDGISAARFLRSIEKKFNSKSHPIIFFSSRKADEKLKKQMTPFAPVLYLNKGSIRNPDELLKRIKILVSRLEGMSEKS